jgi:hypothetical protein
MELLGLSVIVDEAVRAGTLHVIAPPPERADFVSDEAFDRAVARWQRTQLWIVTNVG